MSLDLSAPASATVLVLTGTRIGGALLVAPIFSARTVPVTLRTTLLVLLAWLLHPIALANMASGVAITPAQAATETLIGFGIGLGAAVLVGAAEMMGDLLAVHIGLSGASALDPLTNISVPVLGQFANLFAVTLLLSMDAHLIMIEALASTLRVLPVGGTLDLRAGLMALFSMGSTLFLLGLRFAAPVVAVVLLSNVALAVLTRAAPQLSVLSVAFPIQIGLGLFALAASLPFIAVFFTEWVGAYDGMLGHFLRALTGGR